MKIIGESIRMRGAMTTASRRCVRRKCGAVECDTVPSSVLCVRVCDTLPLDVCVCQAYSDKGIGTIPYNLSHEMFYGFDNDVMNFNDDGGSRLRNRMDQIL